MFDNVKAQELYGKNYLDGSTILSSPAEVGRAILTDNDKYGTPTNEHGYPNEYIFKELQKNCMSFQNIIQLGLQKYILEIICIMEL